MPCTSLTATDDGMLGQRAEHDGLSTRDPGLSPPAKGHITTGPSLHCDELARSLAVGDMVFIRVAAKPFREVAAATGAWTNHVGVVIAVGAEVVVAESTFPFARRTPLRRFIGRSERGRVAVLRLKTPLTAEQIERLQRAVQERLGTFYDTGFNLRSRRQFCSRFVREVVGEATGIRVGTVESFERLLARRPDADLRFWTLWYFGRIPWSRETVTPASLLESPELAPVFDGSAHARRDAWLG